MALTEYEQHALNDLEAELLRVSSRPRWRHVVAALGAHPWTVLGAVVVLAALITLGVVGAPALAVLLGLTAAGVGSGTAQVIWRDATDRWAGD